MPFDDSRCSRDSAHPCRLLQGILVGPKFVYQTDQGKSVKGLIRVRDISQSGIRFSINSMPDFAIGDKLVIQFTLDDHEHSQIQETGIVRRIQNNMVGLSFKSIDHYGKLGQYLFR